MKKSTPAAATVKTSGLASVPAALVPLGQIEVQKNFNPRKLFEGLEELAESIKAAGILQPLLVRPARHARERFELVAGERRLRAAKLAGLKEVPCVIRELTDAEALRVAVLENLQRRDVSALEEADGFQRLIVSGEFTADSLAEKLGKSREHIYGRLRLLKLDKAVLAALDKGDIEATVAGLLAKFPTALQPAILKRLCLCRGEAVSFRDAKDAIEREFRPLREARWLTWAKGKCQESAGTAAPLLCYECPHNSANMPDMVDTKNPVCLDAACYERKTKEHGRWALDDAKRAGRTVVELERSQWTYNQRQTNPCCAWQAVTSRAYMLPFDEESDDCRRWGDWARIAGVVPALALSPAGEAIELVKVSEVREKLIELGKLKPEPKAGRGATKEERRAALAENKARRSETARLGEACLVKVRQMDELDFWRWFWLATDKDYRTERRLGELLGVEKTQQTEEAIAAALLAAPPQERQEKLLRAYLAPNGDWEPFRVEAIAKEVKAA